MDHPGLGGGWDENPVRDRRQYAKTASLRPNRSMRWSSAAQA